MSRAKSRDAARRFARRVIASMARDARGDGKKNSPRKIHSRARTSNANRAIVRESALRAAFQTIDERSSGTIVVGDFLERLKADEGMTDELQRSTLEFVTPEMLDVVFERLGASAKKRVDVKDFIALFSSSNDGNGGGEKASVGVEEGVTTVVGTSGSDMSEKVTVWKKIEDPVVDTTHLRRVFDLLDYDGNGEVTLVEFLGALHSNPEIGVLLDQGTMTGRDVAKDVSDVFSRMDADQNKCVSFDEFVEYFKVQQQSNVVQSLNTMSREEKEKLFASADKERIRSMGALKRGVRFIGKQALKVGLRKSAKERLEENLSKMNDSELYVLKSYVRDVFKLVDYEKRERILIQEFLDELVENPALSVALEVGSTSESDPETSKKILAIVFKALAIDAKVVVEFPEFVNYFLKITSENFNKLSPLAKASARSTTRTPEQNREILLLVGELFRVENSREKSKPRVAEAPMRAPEVAQESVEGDDEVFVEVKSTSSEVSILREQIKRLTLENQNHKKANNALKLKLNVLTHMYSVQSAEYQALIDATA